MNSPEEAAIDAIAGLVLRLLATLDRLEAIGRLLYPPDLPVLVAPLADDAQTLRAAVAAFTALDWADTLEGFRDQLLLAAEATLRACDGLQEAARSAEGLRLAYRAMRQVARATEALYPLTDALPAISRWFVEPSRRTDDALLARFATPATDTGILHAANETNARGGFSVYVPETCDPAAAHPLIMALHGGAGHGRLFLWSWLREARSRGAILVTPTATGDTWSLMEPQIDSAHLSRVLALVGTRWQLDRTRLLLTGMSDGGTFTLISGLQDDSPFTHLAPVAASFHPLLLTMAEPDRVRGLPVYLVHGALDWMFPVSVGRTASRALAAAGAAVVYREIADLSHVYPRDENPAILDWFLGQSGCRLGPDGGGQ
jgi:phospholipase/carboxylesterase